MTARRGRGSTSMHAPRHRGPESIHATSGGPAASSSARSSGKCVQASTITSGCSSAGHQERRQDARKRARSTGWPSSCASAIVHQFRGTDAHHPAIGGETLDQVVGIGPVDRRGRRQQADDLALALLRRRLDRGHHAHHRDAGRGAQLRQADGADGVAGGDDEVGLHARDCAVHHIEEVRQQIGIGPRAIRKERVVAQIGCRACGSALRISATMVRPPRPESAENRRAEIGGEADRRAAPLMLLLGRQSLGRGERLADQARFPCAIERDEGAQARALVLAEQHFVERLEPGAQVGERWRLPTS